MKKLLILLLTAVLMMTTCHAEDMEIMDWSRAGLANPKTADPTPHANFSAIETNGVIRGFGQDFHPHSGINIVVVGVSLDIEDIQVSWTGRPTWRGDDEDWQATVNQETASGQTVILITSESPRIDESKNWVPCKSLWVILPDLPELAGDQWISFRMGNERVTEVFQLSYLGDYREDQGWEMTDRGYFVSPAIEEPAATPEPTATPRPIVLQTKEIQDSWEEILAAIDDGTASQRYAVGAWKELTLDGIGTINMQLAGFELDTLSDGTGKAATTWIAKELLPEKRRMNPGYDGSMGTGAIGGWESCELRAYLQEDVLSAFPAVVRDRLQWVDKTQDAYDESGSLFTQTTSDNLWIPSREEVFGEDSMYYGLLRDSAKNRVRTMGEGSSASWWWLRSAYGTYTIYSVYTNGKTSYTGANFTGGLVVGFCL